MSDQTPSKKSPPRDLTPLWLLIALIAISALRYETVTGSALPHEISQRLYYLPIIYAAYRYGLRGGLTASLVSAALYFPHIVQRLSSRGSAINLYADLPLDQVLSRQREARARASHRRFLERNRSAVSLGEIANDRETEA
jgi:hypothetical protein